MNAEKLLKNFDFEGFMAKEFPVPEARYPDTSRSLEHLNKITRMLMECALQSIRVAELDRNASAVHGNTRYTIVCNYRLRTLNLIKIFTDVLDLKAVIYSMRERPISLQEACWKVIWFIISCTMAARATRSCRNFISVYSSFHPGYIC